MMGGAGSVHLTAVRNYRLEALNPKLQNQRTPFIVPTPSETDSAEGPSCQVKGRQSWVTW